MGELQAIQEPGELVGLNLLHRPEQMGLAYSPNTENYDLSRGTRRPRPSLTRTSYYDSSAAPSDLPIDHLFQWTNPDGTPTQMWWQGTNLYASANPLAVGASAASGTNVTSGLTTTSYPVAWRDLVTDTAWAAEMNGNAYWCNGQDTPLRYSKYGIDKWGIYQPRAFTLGLGVVAAPNTVHQQGGQSADALASGGLRFAYTWENQDGTESNPSPIADWSVGTSSFSPFTVGGNVVLIRVSIAAPTDPQVVKANIYRSLSGDSQLRGPWATIEINSGSGTQAFAADGTNADQRERYGDDYLSGLPVLRTDRFTPPMLAGVVRWKNFLFGWTRWEERFLPGRAGIRGTPATADTTSGSGYVITINPSVTSGRILEAHVGMTIRFPNGADRPYTIVDVLESTQQILIGHVIGGSNLQGFFDQLDAADSTLSTEDFVLEDPQAGKTFYTPAREPEYWHLLRQHDWASDVAKNVTAVAPSGNRLVVFTDAPSIEALDMRSEPATGRKHTLSTETTIGAEHAWETLEDGTVEFVAADGDGIHQIRGGYPTRVSHLLGLGQLGAPRFSVHYRRSEQVWHVFAGGHAYIHNYGQRRGSFSKYVWKRGTAQRLFRTGILAPDQTGANQLWLSDAGGFHWVVTDTLTGVGTADGHASTLDLNFRASGRCTSAGGAAGQIVDTGNTFPDHTAVGSSVIDDPVMVIHEGQRYYGVVTARTDANTLETDISITPNRNSYYEIGVVETRWESPFLRVGHGTHIESAVDVWYVPKEFDGDFEPDGRRHHKHILLQVVDGHHATGVETYAVRPYRKGSELYNVVSPQGSEAIVSPQDDWWAINYTNSMYADGGDAGRQPERGRHRAQPNPGKFSASLGEVGRTFTRVILRELGSRIKGEILGLTRWCAAVEEPR